MPRQASIKARAAQQAAEGAKVSRDAVGGILQRRGVAAQTVEGSAVPATVPEVLRSSGKPLDRDVSAFMGERLGHDFSAVQVHTDDQAAQSARAVAADAYTVSPHVVFGSGRYAPRSKEGLHLIAHELTHVVQQGAPAAPQALRIEQPGSAAEGEADRIAAGLVRGASEPVAPRQRTSGALNRSLLGAGIGGALGGAGLGAAGAGIGSAASHGDKNWGAVGGVIGGVLGLAAGAVIGDLLTRDTRSLTADEKTYAHEIFLESLDYDAITIAKDSALSAGASRTFRNTINLQSHKFKGNTMELTDAGRNTLIHEMVHVWQFQNEGLAYIPSSLIPQAVAGSNGNRNAAYNWRDAVANRIPWPSWNAEEQAKCIADYNEALHRTRDDAAYTGDDGTKRLQDVNTVVIAKPYVELVQQRIGAPGSHPAAGTAGPGS